MTSETCYVYIQLPGSLETVTCGRYQREETDDGIAMGRFVYGRNYLSRTDAVALDPFHLPLSSREYTTAKLDGVFGALRDVLPDFWGRRVIERREHTTDLSEFDYLVYPSRGRIGALEFGVEVTPPSLSGAELPGLHDLSALREAAAKIESDAPIDPDLADLLAAGSLVGGARPKAVIRDEAGTWLAKFPAKEDRWSNAAVEGGMLRLASECGIRTPETRIEIVSDEQILLVKRFDRELASEGDDAEYRHRMVSALTVLDLDDREVVDRSGWSYLLLADELQRWSTEPLLDKRELFRRAVFNALISNTDDHPRNHALIAPPEGWRLSPAYDLTPSPLRSLEHRDLAMTAGEYGRHASRQNLLSASPRFGFDRDAASAVIDEIIGIVERRWRQRILDHGGSDTDCDAVSRAFVYEGFGYPL